MSGIDSSNLTKNKRYKFHTRYNIFENKDDKLPHYYEATYVERKGINNSIWKFKNFTDTQTNKKEKTKEIKMFGILNPVFELKGGKTSRRKTSRRK
jgi:hypothetical protein